MGECPRDAMLLVSKMEEEGHSLLSKLGKARKCRYSPATDSRNGLSPLDTLVLP